MRSRFNRLAAWLLVAAFAAGVATARELAVPPEALIAVELSTVAVIPGSGTPVVLLREPASGDMVPIFIGVAEARAILVSLREIRMPRPMTHDLALDIITRLDGTLERVIVDDLRDGTYHGLLEVRRSADQTLTRIDARPSDALALAVRSGAEILVAPRVLQAGRDLEFEGLASEQVVTALGITVVEATQELREALNLPDDSGVIVTAASGRASYGGIRPGALILKVNDQAPSTPMEYLDLVRKTPSGSNAAITYWHDGARHALELPTDVPTRHPESSVRL